MDTLVTQQQQGGHVVVVLSQGALAFLTVLGEVGLGLIVMPVIPYRNSQVHDQAMSRRFFPDAWLSLQGRSEYRP